MAEVATLGLKVDGVENIERATSSLDGFTRASDKADKSADGLSKGADKGTKSVKALGDTSNSSSRGISALGAAALRAGAIIGAALSVNAIRNYADTWSDMQSQVGAATRDMAGAAAQMTRLTDIANASYSTLSQTVEGYSRNVAVLRDLGRSSSEAADFTESLNHMLVLTATRGERAASVQNALSKAMAVGKLQAEGLETILANGGEVAQALANELGTTVSGLRAMASEGKITGAVIADAIIKPLDDVRDRAAEMPATMADAFVRVNNNLTEFVGRIDKATGASSRIAEIVLGFADGIRTAGTYIIAFGQYSAPAFQAVGSAISTVAQYADIALAALAGFYAPALIGGIALLTSSLAVGLVSAIKAVTAAMLANPIGLITSALVAAGYAAYKFRDDIKQSLGVDVIAVAKNAANMIIGSFVGAYELITSYWKNFPTVFGAVVIGAVNLYIRYINTLVDSARSAINSVVEMARKIPGLGDISDVGVSWGIAEIENPYAKPAMDAAKNAVEAAKKAFKKDWLSGAFEGFKLPDTPDAPGGTGGGGLPPALDPSKQKAAADAAKQNAQAIAELGKNLYLAGLQGEALALAQARMSLNEYATQEQIEQVESLASAIYQVQDAMSRRQKFGQGADADKFILGDSDPLSGGMFDSQYARYEAEAEEERLRYEGQLQRLMEARELQIETNRSYDELELAAAQQHAARMAQIEQAKTSVILTTASDAFSGIAEIMKKSQGEQSSIYRAMFAASKAFAVANATINAYDAISKAWASAPFPANLVAVAATAPQVMALVSAISGAGLSGMAHDGIDSVPQTGTWLLEKGERVTTAQTSARLDSVLDRIDSRQRGDQSVPGDSMGRGGMVVNIIEDPSRAGQTNLRKNDFGEEEADIFVADIYGGGPRSQAIQQAFGLQRQGT